MNYSDVGCKLLPYANVCPAVQDCFGMFGSAFLEYPNLSAAVVIMFLFGSIVLGISSIILVFSLQEDILRQDSLLVSYRRGLCRMIAEFRSYRSDVSKNLNGQDNNLSGNLNNRPTLVRNNSARRYSNNRPNVVGVSNTRRRIDVSEGLCFYHARFGGSAIKCQRNGCPWSERRNNSV